MLTIARGTLRATHRFPRLTPTHFLKTTKAIQKLRSFGISGTDWYLGASNIKPQATSNTPRRNFTKIAIGLGCGATLLGVTSALVAMRQSQSLNDQELDEVVRALGITMAFPSRKDKEGYCFEEVLTRMGANWQPEPEIRKLIVRLKSEEGLSLFQEAVKRGQPIQEVETLHKLFEQERLLHKQKDALHIAVAYGQEHLAPFLMRNFNIKTKNEHGQTAIHVAVQHDRAQMLQILVDHPLSLDESTCRESLILATVLGRKECFDILMKKGLKEGSEESGKINIFNEIVDSSKNNLLHLAVSANQYTMLDHLRKEYHDATAHLVRQKNIEGLTPLLLACREGHENMVRLLGYKGGDLLKLRDNQKRSALHLAAAHKHIEVLRLLYRMGADFEAVDARGRTVEQAVEGNDPLAAECRFVIDRLTWRQRLQQDLPANYIEHPPHYLVLSGGGAKGVLYPAAIQELKKQGVIDEVHTIVATSAGSIMAALMAGGYTPDEIEKLSEEMAFESFLDYDKKGMAADAIKKVGSALGLTVASAIINPPIVETAAASLLLPFPGLKTLFFGLAAAKVVSKFKFISSMPDRKKMLDELVKLPGLCKGEKLRQWLDDRLYDKTGIHHLTFGELRTLAKKEPEKFKDLYVFAVKLQQSYPARLIRLGSTNEEPELEGIYSDLIISDSVRCSSSIPGVFKSHKLHYKDRAGERRPYDKLGELVDGGLLLNFPINAFDDKRTGEANRRVLGLGFEVARQTQMEPIQQDVVGLVNAYMHSAESLNEMHTFNTDRMILLPTHGLGMIPKKLTAKEKEAHSERARQRIQEACNRARAAK